MDVERAAEDEGEAQDVVDLVRIVRPPRRDDRVGPRCARIGRRDFGIGVRHREDDRRGRHVLDHLGLQRARGRQAEEHVGADKCFGQVARFGWHRVRRLPLVHAFGAALIDGALAVAHDDIFVPHAHRLDQRGACDRRGAGAVDDDLHRREIASRQVTGVDQAGRGDDRGAVLVVMEHRDVHAFFQRRLDDEAVGRGNIFQVDAAKARREQFDRFDEALRIFGIDLKVDRIDVGEALEQHRLAFHHRLRCERAEIAEPEDRGAVRDHRDQIALDRIVIGLGGILGDRVHRNRDTRRIGKAEVALRRHRLRRDDLDFSGPAIGVVQQRLAVRKLHLAATIHRLSSQMNSQDARPSPFPSVAKRKWNPRIARASCHGPISIPKHVACLSPPAPLPI